jgi:hypothetical protein
LSEQWGGRLGPRFGAHPTGGIRGKGCHWDSRPFRLSWIRKLGTGTALLTLSIAAFQTCMIFLKLIYFLLFVASPKILQMYQKIENLTRKDIF